MINPRPLLVLALAALTACGGSESTGPTVTQVTVTPGTSTVNALGETVQFAARAVDGSGQQVTGETISWSSSDVSVATVSDAGLATAVSAGTAAITATVAGVAGSAVLTVNPIADCDEPEQVSLAPGEWTKYDARECILLPSGSNGDRYRVALTRPKETGAASDVATATLRVSGIGVTESPAAPAPARQVVRQDRPRIAGLSDEALRQSIRMAEATSRFHVELRQREAELIRRIGAENVLPPRPDGGLARVARAEAPERLVLDVGTSTACTEGEKRTALLIHENDDIAIYQDSIQANSQPISVGSAQSMANYYSAYGVQMLKDYFGTPTDLDGNGKIAVYIAPTSVVESETAAFVFSGDFFPKESCPNSNEMELIFFNTSLVLAMEEQENPSFQALETLAHEAYHIVSLYQRIRYGTDNGISNPYHPTWVEEGRAEVAGEMSSRIGWADKGGPSVTTQIERTHFENTGVTPENYGVLLRMARSIWYLSSQPNALVVTPSGAGEGHDIYGTGWHFHRWLGDAYGGGITSAFADAGLFTALTDSTARPGFGGLVDETGKDFYGLFDEFVAAVALHGTGAPQPAIAFQAYDFITATDVLANQPEGAYPWPVTTTSNGPSAGFESDTYEGPIGPSGIRIHEFRSNGTGTGAQITTDVVSPAELVVVRIR